MFIEFPRVFDRVSFIAIDKRSIELGYGKYAVTLSLYPEGGGFFVCWMI